MCGEGLFGWVDGGDGRGKGKGKGRGIRDGDGGVGWKCDGGGGGGRLDGGEESEREMVECLVVRTDWVGFEGLEAVERSVIGMDGLIGGFRMEIW